MAMCMGPAATIIIDPRARPGISPVPIRAARPGPFPIAI